ncbi:MAG: DUF2318 domain-containing protein [Gorillibacterium sp.]|nr:DUF2318 domain-containing protein [Gorillibacterium sp.]
MSRISNNQKPSQKKPQRNTKFFLLGTIAIVFVVIIMVMVFGNQPNSPTAEATKVPVVKDSDLVIPIREITEKATFYPVDIMGTRLEVLAVKAPDGTIRTAFNTCQVCFSSGKGYYIQEGDVLVCQNCGNKFKMSDVEVTKGGCNPVPISLEDKIVDNDNITIEKEYLTESKTIFANWKSL